MRSTNEPNGCRGPGRSVIVIQAILRHRDVAVLAIRILAETVLILESRRNAGLEAATSNQYATAGNDDGFRSSYNDETAYV